MLNRITRRTLRLKMLPTLLVAVASQSHALRQHTGDNNHPTETELPNGAEKDQICLNQGEGRHAAANSVPPILFPSLSAQR